MCSESYNPLLLLLTLVASYKKKVLFLTFNTTKMEKSLKNFSTKNAMSREAQSTLTGGGRWELMEIDGVLHLVWVDEIDVIG